jgi:hypothetical protein
MKHLSIMGVKGLEVPKTPLLKVVVRNRVRTLYICDAEGKWFICSDVREDFIFAAVAIVEWMAIYGAARRFNDLCHCSVQIEKWRKAYGGLVRISGCPHGGRGKRGKHDPH